MSSITQKKVNILQRGLIKCLYCSEILACKLLEQHCLHKHPEKKDLCAFCGIVTMKRNKSGLRILTESKAHFVECAREAKKKFKSQAEIPKPIYEYTEIFATKFIPVKHNGTMCEMAIDSMVLVEKDRYDEALQHRSKRCSGDEDQLVQAENIRTDDVERVETELWLDYDFSPPAWLQPLINSNGNRATYNKLEFHESFNIDTAWPKVYGLKELEFLHLSVHMCVFEKFRRLLDIHRDKCSLLRYMCMCNKHGRVHLHVVMVALKEAKIKRLFNIDCEVTNEQRRLTKLLKEGGNGGTKTLWPYHRHLHVKDIVSDMHLFNTLRYIGSRDSDCPQMDNHFYIFRTLPKDAPLWFAAISRNGLYSYVRYIMDKRSVIDELDNVVVSNFHKCLEYQHILHHLMQAAIPLGDGDYLYHSVCQGNAIPLQQRDLRRYIHLGRNEYMYLGRGEPCCDVPSKDIFFANQTDSVYCLTSRQRREYDIYQRGVERGRREKNT